MTPRGMVTRLSPFVSVQPGLPSRSPDMRIGGFRPSFTASVKDSSICVSLRAGPTTRSAILPFSVSMVTRSLQANWPGWIRSRIFVS